MANTHGKPFLSLWKGPVPNPGDSRNMREIVRDLADSSGVSVAEIMGDSRTRRIAHVRQEAMAQMRATGRYSFPQIGRFFNRDHATVIHACRRVAERHGLIVEAQAA